MSFFYNDGAIAMVVGNIGFVVAIVSLHALLVAIVAKLQGVTSYDTVKPSFIRFPAMSLRVADFFLPGTTYAAFLCFWSPADGAVAAGIVGVTVVGVCFIATSVAFWRIVHPQCAFVGYPTRVSSISLGATKGAHSVRTADRVVRPSPCYLLQFPEWRRLVLVATLVPARWCRAFTRRVHSHDPSALSDASGQILSTANDLHRRSCLRVESDRQRQSHVCRRWHDGDGGCASSSTNCADCVGHHA